MGDDLEQNENNQQSVIHVSGMYQNWFLDYARRLFYGHPDSLLVSSRI